MKATVNDNASGVWSGRVGQVLEVVRPGLNPYHLIVKRKGERRTFGMPTKWLDVKEET